MAGQDIRPVLEGRSPKRTEAFEQSSIPEEVVRRETQSGNNNGQGGVQLEYDIQGRNSGQKIMKIEAFLNQGAWNRQQQLTQKNLNYVTHKSVCVVITSDAGQSLADLGLKLERYERSRRQAVRFWTGPVPWPLNHEEQSSVVELQW